MQVMNDNSKQQQHPIQTDSLHMRYIEPVDTKYRSMCYVYTILSSPYKLYAIYA